MEKIEAVVKVARDGFIEVPCEEAVAGDEIRVTLAVEEWVVDAEGDMARLAQRLRREREESPEDFVGIPWEQVKAEMDAQKQATAEAEQEQGANYAELAQRRAA